eukprot:9793415-Alexandrium_andersonii.AAC.1
MPSWTPTAAALQGCKDARAAAARNSLGASVPLQIASCRCCGGEGPCLRLPRPTIGPRAPGR